MSLSVYVCFLKLQRFLSSRVYRTEIPPVIICYYFSSIKQMKTYIWTNENILELIDSPTYSLFKAELYLLSVSGSYLM